MDTCLDEGSVAMVSWLPRLWRQTKQQIRRHPQSLTGFGEKGPVHKVMRQAAGTLWICDIGVSLRWSVNNYEQSLLQ